MIINRVCVCVCVTRNLYLVFRGNFQYVNRKVWWSTFNIKWSLYRIRLFRTDMDFDIIEILIIRVFNLFMWILMVFLRERRKKRRNYHCCWILSNPKPMSVDLIFNHFIIDWNYYLFACDRISDNLNSSNRVNHVLFTSDFFLFFF